MIKLKDKISIIVPIYNAELYLTQCIESILVQTYSNLQIILVDDGSTDMSGMICDNYAKVDKRIEVYHTNNKGLVAARKLGIVYAVGEYIGFVDADDYVEANMFEILLNNIVKSNADFIHTGYIQEFEGKKEFFYDFEESIFDLINIKSREQILIQYVLMAEREKHISHSIWSKLFKKELIKQCYLALPEHQQYGEDLLCLCLCILKSKRIKLCRQALYHYRIQGKSLSHLQNNEQVIKEIQLSYSMIELIQKYNKQIFIDLEKYLCFFFKNRYLNLIEVLNKNFIRIPRFSFKNISILKGKQIVLYGAGCVGQDYYSQFCKYKDIDIVAWVDLNWQNYSFNYASVSNISILSECTFDIIVIAVNKEIVAKEIKKYLLECGFSNRKIIWEEPINILENGLS